MKNLFKNALLALASFCFCIAVNGQTIRRVNNNPGVTGVNVYATVQAAHDAAGAGDIIYLEPGGNYGFLNCTKNLKIIGPGFTDRNNNLGTTPNPPVDTRMATLSGVDFQNGSQNSTMSGVMLNSNGGSFNSYIKVPNISIDRCVFIGGSPTFAFQNTNSLIVSSNINITRCYFSGYIGANTFPISLGVATSCLIANNVFYSGGGGANSFTSSIIANNIFGGNGYASGTSCTVYNNIFLGSSSIQEASGSGATNSISNNLATSNTLPSGNGNINNAVTGNIFTGNPNSGSTLTDTGWQLASGSPAIGTGTSGGNMGIYGGANPWVIAGLPPIPILTNFISTGAGNTITPLSVSVTVRGNN